ncbi:MAG: CD225/dispanin family protein [Paramuribaculum sp.]|nr:CD225/dispanin family protein [Paramuribaculum sp.]MDE6460015.1 CD225/dispanin family protein [Paramuribaculum sp.]
MENNNYRYWAIHNGMRIGPVSFGELMELGIRPETPVWRAGLADWCEASAVPEITQCLEVNIPPVPMYPPDYTGTWHQTPYIPEVPRQEKPMPPTYLVWSIITTLLCCIPTGIVAIIYSSKVNSRFTSGDYDGAQKASDAAAIWILVTVVLGLISLPFQILISLL